MCDATKAPLPLTHTRKSKQTYRRVESWFCSISCIHFGYGFTLRIESWLLILSRVFTCVTTLCALLIEPVTCLKNVLIFALFIYFFNFPKSFILYFSLKCRGKNTVWFYMFSYRFQWNSYVQKLFQYIVYSGNISLCLKQEELYVSFKIRWRFYLTN